MLLLINNITCYSSLCNDGSPCLIFPSWIKRSSTMENFCFLVFLIPRFLTSRDKRNRWHSFSLRCWISVRTLLEIPGKESSKAMPTSGGRNLRRPALPFCQQGHDFLELVGDWFNANLSPSVWSWDPFPFIIWSFWSICKETNIYTFLLHNNFLAILIIFNSTSSRWLSEIFIQISLHEHRSCTLKNKLTFLTRNLAASSILIFSLAEVSNHPEKFFSLQ